MSRITRADIIEWQVLRIIIAAGKGNARARSRLRTLEKKLEEQNKGDRE